MADLCALADGTISPARRPEVEAWVASSPELQELLERQRRSLAAAQALRQEPVPDSLRQVVAAMRPAPAERPGPHRWLAPRLGIATALVVAAAVVGAVVLSRGPGAPSVAQAALLANQPATAPAPAVSNGSKLALGVQGVSFPNLDSVYGWRATGVRRGRVDGRAETIVFYRNGARRIAYVIISGPTLPRPKGGQVVARNGIEYQTLQLNGKLAVTWRQGGHTCILLGQSTQGELLTLAAWSA
jgi:hypothetical protein